MPQPGCFFWEPTDCNIRQCAQIEEGKRPSVLISACQTLTSPKVKITLKDVKKTHGMLLFRNKIIATHLSYDFASRPYYITDLRE